MECLVELHLQIGMFGRVPPLKWKCLVDLHLKNGKECLRQIELLEEEMRNQNKLGADQNVPIINSLIGFMRYCKCVLFGVT